MDDIQNQYGSNDNRREVVQGDEIDLLDYIRVVFKYRWMILLICGVAVVTTAIISLSSPKVYSATATIVPPIEILQRESDIAGRFGARQSPILRQAIGVASVAQMYVGILESRAVADAIIDRFDLMTVYEEQEYRSNARRTLKSNSTIKVTSEGIVRITVKDRDPSRAAAIANAYVEELDEQNKRLSSGQATSKRLFLENRLKEIEQELSRIEDLPSREAKTKEMLLEMLAQEYEIAKIEEAKSMPTIQVLDQAVAPEIRMPRGAKKKTMLAGVVSLLLAVFVSFAREYFVKVTGVETRGQRKFPFRSRQQSSADSTLNELESKRKTIAMRRRKRTQENESYSQEAEA
jgi:uncharacterized protein involved in exopolysaccharide biosynthesis